MDRDLLGAQSSRLLELDVSRSGERERLMDIQLLANATNTFSELIRGKQRWDEIRRELLKVCGDLFNAEVCAIFLVRDDQQLVLEDHIGYTSFDGKEFTLQVLRESLRYRVGLTEGDGESPSYDGLTGQVASLGEECSYEASQTKPSSWQGKPDHQRIWDPERRPFRSMFAVPLMFENVPIGVLKVENKKDPHGGDAVFDEVDKNILRALGNLFSIAVRLSYLRGLPYEKLFTTTLEWLERFDRQKLYQNMVEFCAQIFQADVCALFVHNGEGNDPKMSLVAGRLRNADTMDIEDLIMAGKDPAYSIALRGDGSFDGITGRIANTGRPLKIDSFSELQELRPAEPGKWDELVWGGDAQSHFGCMIGVPLKHEGKGDPIGILKVERGKDRPTFNDEDLDMLIQAANGFAAYIVKSGRQLAPGRGYEYRITPAASSVFYSKLIEGVVIGHLMTSICQSDVYYFKHKKDSKKLEERLPMPLGHETVGEILSFSSPSARYSKGEKMRTGDKVFVIPLIPCENCHVCKGKYGENYCPSSRFMASNARGSLRASYQYEAKLVLKIEQGLEPYLAVFAEPMANVVQLLNELGFVKNGIDMNMKPFDSEEFRHFRVLGEKFTNIFNTIIDSEPHPRTLFVLSDKTQAHGRQLRTISQQGIMRKGLGLLGQNSSSVEPTDFTRRIDQPHVLILGTSVSAYLLAMILRYVYKIPSDRITVTGRTIAKLAQFVGLANSRIPIKFKKHASKEDLETFANLLTDAFGPSREPYDIAFECIGEKAVQQHIQLSLRVLKPGGILAMFGLTEDSIEIDFAEVLRKEIYIKGTYRASLKAYQDALNYIIDHVPIRRALEEIIDTETVVRKHRGKWHDISDEQHLTEVFEAAAARREKLGRLIIGRLGHES